MKTTLRLRSVSVAIAAICIFAHLQIRTFAQNVGISATGINPDNSAMLDVTSTTKGMLIPRMTGAEKYAIPSPATGLFIFQTDTVGFWYYDGTKWIPLVSSTSSTASPSNAGWLTTGNIGTAYDKNFLGTTDNVSLRIRTNNTEKMIVDSLGRVGIGITNPAYKLDILDSNSAGSGVQSRTLNNYQIRTEANITTATTAIGIKNTLLYRMTEGTPGTQGIGMTANNTVYADGAYTYFGLYGANNQAYTISTALANQNALYGSVNTGYLNSSGVLANGFGAYNHSYNASSGTITSAIGAQNYAWLATGATGTITNAYGSNNTVQNTSTVGGSMGIAYGVNSNIIKAATASAIGTGYLYYGAYGSSGTATKHYGIYITGEDTNYFSGKVGIGTASPLALLNISGTTSIANGALGSMNPQAIFMGGNSNNRLEFGMDNRFATAIGFIQSRNTITGATYLSLNPGGGNVGIGTTAPTQALHVIGNGLFTGTVTASCGLLVCSDIRYKKDITPLSHALDKVLSMQGVNYHWKTKEFPEKQFTADNQIGFIAQELEKIVPEVVMTDKDGYKSVDYSRLTPVLVEAIKELKKENDSLKASSELKIENLKVEYNNRIKKLEDLLGVKAEK